MSNGNKIVPLIEYLTRRNINEKTRVIAREMKNNRQLRFALRNKRVMEIVTHAGRTVPYYQSLFKKVRFKPEKLEKDISYLNDIPYLTKEMIHLNPQDFISSDFSTSNAFVRKTSGSTGRSLDIFFDTQSLDWTAAVSRYSQQQIGRTFGKKEVLLNCEPSWRGRSMVSKATEVLKSLALNRSVVLTKTFDPEALEELYHDLKSKNAFLVQGHPSTVYHLAVHLKQTGKAPLQEKLFDVFESTGETISVDHAKFIEEHLGCKTYNKYGAAEFGVVAYSTDDIRKLNIIDTCFYAENFVYGFGLPEVVITGTLNKMMPLIRYRTGDLGEISYEGDSTYLFNPMGRLNDILEVNNKLYPTHYLKDQLARVGDIDDFQVIITKERKKRIMVVASNSSCHQAIRNFVSESLSPEIEVNFVKLNQLIRVGWRDKFKYLIYEQ